MPDVAFPSFEISVPDRATVAELQGRCLVEAALAG